MINSTISKVNILTKDEFLYLNGIHRVLPIDAIEDVYNFKTIIKSPYSNSFYDNDKVGWDYKENGTLRISNHWNFITKHSAKIHSVTDISVINNKIYLGKYENGIYKILKSYSGGYYNSKLELGEKYPKFLEQLLKNIEENKQRSIQMQKDVSNGLIYGEFIKKDTNEHITGKLVRLGNQFITFDNGFQIRVYGNEKTKGNLNLFKSNDLLKKIKI